MGCWLWRHGWGIVLVLTVLLSVAAGLAFKRHLLLQLQTAVAESDALNARLSDVQRTPPVPAPASPDAKAYQALQAATYQASEANNIVRRIHVMSREHQVIIAESDYRINSQGFGGLKQQQLTLPLQGKYPAVKAFVMQLLKEYPGLSVDQVMLRREDVSRDKPEVTIKVSLWVLPAAQPSHFAASSAAQ
jgi:hypothetical protein